MPISFADYINDGSLTSLLILGYPGSGKTTLATQLPSPYILECDNNLAGPMNYVIRKNLNKDAVFDIPHVIIKPDGTREIVPRSQRFQRYAKLCAEAARSGKYKTLVTDSITTWRDYVEDEVRRLNKKAIAGEAGAQASDPISQPDFGTLYGVAKQHIITCKAYGLRSVFLGHVETRKEEIHKNEDKANYIKYLAFPGQLRESMAGLFDEVWMIESEPRTTSAGKEFIRVIRTIPEDWREKPLGLKTSTSMGYKFVLDDFSKLNEKLGEVISSK